ncbi:hypothetical protein D3C78_771660 [compost metagenome]
MLEALETGPGQDSQTLGQGDLILDERRVGLEVFLVVGRGAGQGWTRLAVHRVEDIDRVGTHRAAGALDDRLVVVILVLDAGQQGVIETARGEMAGEVELGVFVRPLQLAVVEVAAQGASVRGHTVGFDRITLEGPVEPLESAAQRPVIAQQMLEPQLRHVVVVVQFASVFFAEEGIARGRADLVWKARQAAIERVIVAHEVAFENHLGVIGGLPGQHRCHAVTFCLDMIAEGISALAHHIQAIGQAPLFVQRAGGIQRAALHALVIELAAQGHRGHGQGLFGNDVEGTARIASAIEHGRRPSQHFQSLDGVGIGHVRIATVDRKPVAIELPGGKAAHGKGRQALAAEIVGPPHPAGVIEGVLQPCGTDVLHNIPGHHTDGLGRFVDRRVGARGAGRTRRAIAVHGSHGGFKVCCANDVSRLQLQTGFIGSCLLRPRGSGECLKHANRHQSTTHLGNLVKIAKWGGIHANKLRRMVYHVITF